MARTRKSTLPENLYQYDVLIEDTNGKSDYFKLTQFDGYFYGGRNAFLIAGSPTLKTNTNILIEILDSGGTTIYSAPVADYIEGSSRLIQLEVYENTPIGVGKIVILGCAETYLDGTPVPLEWRDKFNVRWVSDVVISPNVENITPIRFEKLPSMVVEEKFYFTPSSSAFEQQSVQPVDIELSTKYLNTSPNGYLVKIKGPGDTTKYLSKYLGGVLSGSFTFNNGSGPETASINLPITRIFNSELAEVDGTLIYTDKDRLITSAIVSSSGTYTSLVQPIGNITISSSLNLLYNELITESTGSTISFAEIRIVDLETLSGEINKVRIAYKPSTDPGEFKLLGEVNVGVAELLAVDSGSKIVQTGYFNTIIVDEYWTSATMSVQRTDITLTPPNGGFGQNYYNTSSLITSNSIKQSSAFLLDSINATPEIENGTFKNCNSYFIGTTKNNLVTLFPNSEYTFSFKALAARQSASISLNQSDYTLEVYLVQESGSNGKILDTNNMGQLIGKLTPSNNFLKQNFDTVEMNFVPKINESGNFGIRFVVYGGFWNIADVSIKTAVEALFSPDEANILLPNTVYTNKLLTFKANYLDINNNSVNVSTLSLPTYFTGSEQSITASAAISSSYALTASYAMNAGAGDTYTNTTPVPVTLGGISASSTFTDVPLTEMFDRLLYPYQVPAFTEFSITGQSTTLEVGNQITSGSKTFTWVTSNSSNVSSSGITISDFTNSTTIATGLTNTGTTNQTITAVSKSSATSHVYRISAKNTQDTTFTRDYTVNWRWRMYWGTSSLASLTASDITGSLISSSLVTNSTGTFPFGTLGYKYIAYPTEFGEKTTFKDVSTGFDVDMQPVVTTAVSNSFGVGTNYYVHRSTNVLGGSITITVS